MDLNLQDWQALVALIAAALGTVATLSSAFGSSARKLRGDLTSDAKLSEYLDGQAATDLHETIRDRSHLLVAATRFPSLTGYEIALTFLFVPVFLWLFVVPDNLRELSEMGDRPIELSGIGQLFSILVALVTYSALARSWSTRAEARIVYVYERLGDDTARQQVRELAFPAYIFPLVFILSLWLALTLNVRAIFEVYEWRHDIGILITAGLGLGILAIVTWLSRRERLSEFIGFYTDVLFAAADIPKLRPAELGQTEEDLARYEKALSQYPQKKKRGTVQQENDSETQT